jgi:hypothetical protein
VNLDWDVKKAEKYVAVKSSTGRNPQILDKIAAILSAALGRPGNIFVFFSGGPNRC